MAQWKVTDPNTNESLTIEGDVAPSQQDVAEIFQHKRSQPTGNTQPQTPDVQAPPSVGGFLHNVGTNIGKITSGFMNIPSAMGNLQKQYGTPNELLASDPLKYAQIMTSPIQAQIKNYAGYTPLPDIAAGTPEKYLGRVATKAYNEPVTTALDVLSALQLAKTLAPNPQALAQGNLLKEGVFPSQVKEAAQAALPTQPERMPLNQSMAKNTYASIWNVPKYKGTYGLDAGRTAKELLDYGVQANSLDDIMGKANQVTGTNGAITGIKMDALQAVGDAPIDTTSVVQSMTKKLLEIPGMTEQKAFSIADGYIKNLAATSVPGQFNLSNAFEVEQKLGAKARQYTGAAMQSGNPDIKDYAKAFQYGQDELKMQIDEAITQADKNGGTALLDQYKTPERIAQLESVSPKLAQAVQDATSIADLQRIERTFVNASILSKETLKQMTRPLSTIGQNVGYGLGGGALGLGLGGIPGMITGSVLGPMMRPLLNSTAEAIRTPLATNIARGLYNLPGASLAGVGSQVAQGVAGQAPNIANILRMVSQGQLPESFLQSVSPQVQSQQFPSPGGTAYVQ